MPFARSGNQARWEDARSNCFTQTLECIKDQATRPGSVLEAFLIENVLGMLDCKGDGKTPAAHVEEWLVANLGPEWAVWTWRVETARLGIPQNRKRVYICGRKVSLFQTPAPDCQPMQFKINTFSLSQILDSQLPRQDLGLTPLQKQNLAFYKKVHNKDLEGSIVVCDLSRSCRGQRSRIQSRNDGLVPTLTTRNRHLFVFQVGHWNSLLRYLSPQERCMLQGFKPSVLERIPRSKVMTATGNAMSMSAVGITIACCLQGRVGPQPAAQAAA